MVAWKEGFINCENIKNVSTVCSGVVPHNVRWGTRGPMVSDETAKKYY